MTKHLSLGDMVTEMARLEVAELIAMEAALDKSAKLVERTAKSEFGHYQPGIGGFPAWSELADSTKDERVRLGFTENDPLERTHALEETISHEKHGLEAAIGSTSEIMVFHEFGDAKMPARPVLGPALLRNLDKIKDLAAGALIAGFVGEEAIHEALGYTRDA